MILFLMTNAKCVAKIMVMSTNSITPNLKIESMLIHPTKQGYRNNKNKNKNEIHNKQRINFERVGEFEYKAEVE